MRERCGALKGANIRVVRRSAVAHADDLRPRRRVHGQRLELGVDDSARAPECSRMYWISEGVRRTFIATRTPPAARVMQLQQGRHVRHRAATRS
jgi:hypothetical protein